MRPYDKSGGLSYLSLHFLFPHSDSSSSYIFCKCLPDHAIFCKHTHSHDIPCTNKLTTPEQPSYSHNKNRNFPFIYSLSVPPALSLACLGPVKTYAGKP